MALVTTALAGPLLPRSSELMDTATVKVPVDTAATAGSARP
jgi:hypothetical protein